MSNKKKAAEDLKYLLDRGYKKNTAVNLVVNRYDLSQKEKNFLLRYVYSEEDILLHKSKLISLEKIAGKDIVVDGYNILITVEAILAKKEVVMGMDGFLRDTSAVFSNYVFGEKAKQAVKTILSTLKKYRPRHVLFVFDSQISRSGELAAYVRRKILEQGFSGDARTSRSADYEIVSMNKITLSTDSIIIEKVRRAVDLCSSIREAYY